MVDAGCRGFMPLGSPAHLHTIQPPAKPPRMKALHWHHRRIASLVNVTRPWATGSFAYWVKSAANGNAGRRSSRANPLKSEALAEGATSAAHFPPFLFRFHCVIHIYFRPIPPPPPPPPPQCNRPMACQRHSEQFQCSFRALGRHSIRIIPARVQEHFKTS